MTRKVKHAGIFILMMAFAITGFGQRDTSRPVSIDITSAYQPVLRNASKINFSGSQLQLDTQRTVRSYRIPSQSLYYSYQPIPLRPLAMEKDTLLQLGIRHFVKAGFGSQSTPYLNAGLSFGDGKNTLLNVYGDYISSKGSIKNQDYSILNIGGAGSYFLEDHEVYGGIKLSDRTYHLFGYDHSLYEFAKKDVRQKFQEVDLRGGFRNTKERWGGLRYDPTMRINFFTLTDKVSETNLALNVPVEKTLYDQWKVSAAAGFDHTRYSTDKQVLPDISFTNNLVWLKAAVKYYQPRLMINGGFSPVWSNGKLNWLPEVFFEAQLTERVLMLQGGWIGRMYKNSLRDLSGVNPFVQPLQERFNTRETEFYGGIKATLGSHFNFSGKVSWITYKDFALFLNDTIGVLRSFTAAREEKINNLRVHGNVSYIIGETLNLTGSFTLNAYTGQKTFEKAWNTIPMEIRASGRWWAWKRLMLKTDIFTFAGGKVMAAGVKERSSKGGTDISVGGEFIINNQFSAWLDANNLLSDKYERWPLYPVYGLNVLGGIRINF